MNTVRYLLTLALLTCLAATTGLCQATGDYGSAGTGNWGTTGTNWVVCVTPGTWADAVAAVDTPHRTSNVWIRGGHTVTLEGSPRVCGTLTVESGAKLWTNSAVTSPRYVRVYGTTITNEGTVGGPGDALSVYLPSASQTLTLTGSGSYQVGRIQPNGTGQTIIIDADIGVNYAGSTGTGSSALYANLQNNTTITINAGKTVTMAPSAYIAIGTSGTSAGNATMTINVHGTLVTQSNSIINLNNTSPNTSTVNVYSGGAIHLGSILRGDAGTGNVNVVVNTGGAINAPDTATYALSAAATTVDGTIDFGNSVTGTRSLGTATVGATGTLRFMDGTFPTGSVTLGSGSTVEYYGSSGITLGASPATYANLLITNSAGVTLGGNVTVDGTLSLEGGTVTTGANTLAISSTGSVARTSGHVNGNLQKNFATGAGVARSFEIGDAADYTPVNVTFANVSTGGDLAAASVTGDHPSIATSGIAASKSVNRYWSLANGGVVFDSYDATFTFVAGDVDAGAVTGSFIAEKYGGGIWSDLTEGTRTATSTQITGASSFSDFAIGEAATAEFQLSAASLSFGDVLVSLSKEDSVFVRNVGVTTLHLDSITCDNPLFVASTTQDTVLAGDSMKVTVTFSPIAVTAESGNIGFFHDAATSPDTLLVSGAGIAAPPVLSNGTGGGDWNTGSTWIGGVVPVASDNVVVQTGDSVSLGAAGSCTNLTLAPGAKLALNASNLTIPGSSWAFDSTSTVTYNGTSTVQSAMTYGSLTYATSGSGSCNGNLTVKGDLTITTSTFRGNAGTSGSFTHTVQGSVIVGPGTGARISAVNNGSATSASCTWNISGNLLLTGNNSGNRVIFYESAGPHSGSAAFSIGGNLEIGTGSQVMFKSTSGTSADYPGGTLTVNGNLVQNGPIGINSASAGSSPGLTVNLGGTSPQTWSGTGAFAVSAFTVTVNVNNAAGVSLAAPRTINNNVVLALVNGKVSTTSLNLLTITTGTLTGGSDTSYVNGPLAKSIGTGSPNHAFPIGDNAVYTPVAVQFGTVTVGGTLTASTTAGDHAQIATSGIYPALSLNRTYTLTADTGMVFDTCSAVFSFAAGDLDAGADPLLFIGQKYNGSWSDLTEGAKTATSIQITGLASFSDFAFGQQLPVTILSNGTGGGLWGVGTSWQGGIVPAVIDSVVILGGDSVAVAANSQCGGLRVEANGKLSLYAQLATTNALIDGYVGVYADTLKRFGTIVVDSAGIYEQARNGGTIPTATWNSGSTCMITGITANTPSNGRQTFANLVWNCPGQTANLNLGWNSSTASEDATTTINGDITVLSTGTGRWQFCAPPAGTAIARSVARVNIMGGIRVSGRAVVTATGSSNNYTDNIITVLGNVSVTDSGSQLSISRGSQGGTGTVTWYFKGDSVSYGRRTVNQNSTDANTAATTRGRFVFNRAGTQFVYVDSANAWTGECNMQFGDSVTATTVSIGNSQFAGSACTQRILPGAIVIVGPEGFIGGGTNSNSIPSSFAIEDGATLAMESPQGILSAGPGGAVRVSGTRTYASGADYAYVGSAPQATGGGLPPAVHNLTIINAAGVTLDSTALVTVNGALNLANGVLSTGPNTVSISPSGVVNRVDGHVAGNLRKNVATGAGIERTFEIGDAANYTPVLLTIANVSTSGDLTATTVAGDHPNIATSGIKPQHSVNRTWSLANAGIVFDTYDAAFRFVTTDVDTGADPATFIVERYSGGTWSGLTEGNRTATSTQITGATSFSDFAIGEPTGVGTDEARTIPTEFGLEQNYPNPFNPSTHFVVNLPREGDVEIAVYTLLGQRVRTIVAGHLSPGSYTFAWDGMTDYGAASSGIYLVRVVSGSDSAVRKIIMAK